MKGNKMSAILAIMLMLAGAFAIVPLGHGQPPAPPPGYVSLISSNAIYPLASQPTAAQSNPNTPFPPVTNLHFAIGVNDTAGSKFWVDIDAYNVSWLSTYTVGCVFNPQLFQCLAAVNGTVTRQLSASKELATPPATIDNVGGTVTAAGYSATDSYSFNGTLAPQYPVELWAFEFQLTGNATYENMIAGTPQTLVGLSYTNVTIGTAFIDVEGNTFTPPMYNATAIFTKHIGQPMPPIASSVVTPPTVTVGTAQTFDATGSTQGFNGTINVPITSYVWNFNNGTIITTHTPTITETFPAPGTYTVTLTVVADGSAITSNHYNMTSAPENQVATVYPKASGCDLRLYTQSWRYVDPYYINTTSTGAPLTGENNTTADTFRPGDLVELFANATYNGAPVQGALVSFEVWDNNNNVVLIAEAITSCTGLAQWEFRIPWPSTEGTVVNNFTEGSFGPTENTSQFGTWRAIATWQLGSQLSELPPFEKTQTTGIYFDVEWGLVVSIVSVSPNPAYRGQNSCGYGQTVTIKVNVCNYYLEVVPGYIYGTIYDNLLVPIYPPSALYVTPGFPAGTVNATSHNVNPTCTDNYTLTQEIPSYAFVGTGYVVVDLLTAPPSMGGTSYCPTVWTNIGIIAHP